jgi:hypothetical protein
MDYMRMLSYVFENPNWLTTILLAALIGLIPILGPLVLAGYKYEVVIGLLATGGGRYPDFDFGRFADYLVRGLWPFLIGLIVGMVFGALMVLPTFIGLAGDAGVAIGAILQLGMLLLFPIALIILQPMLLRAALTQDFAQGFQIDWVKDFFSKVGVEVVLGFLFWYIAAMFVGMLGLLACCIGIVAVAPFMSLAQAHLFYQLYSLYLTRGGIPIPIQPTSGFGPPSKISGPPPLPPKPLA